MITSAEVVLGRRQLYMLPSQPGALFALLLAALLLAAINYSNGLVYGLTFLLAAIGVVSMLHTHRNLHRLRVSAAPAPPVFAGDTALFHVFVSNDADVPRYGVVIEHGRREIARLDIAPRASASAVFAVPTRRRGHLRLPEFSLTTRYPLGLIHSWSRPIALDARAMVYPAPAGHAAAGAPADGAGAGTTRPGQGDDFLGQREYRQGDSLRRVNWKALARGQGWLVKEFGSSGAAAVWLDWELLAGLDPELRLSALCRAVLDAEQQAALYGLRLPGTVIAPASGEAHQAQCLEALALFRG